MSRQQQAGDATVRSTPGAKTGLGSKPPIKVTKMIKTPTTKAKHTPSSYLFEMKQSTEEKLADTREMYPPQIIELLDVGTSSHQKDVTLDVDQALFQPFPSKVVFQQFEAHKTYVFPLQLRNLDKVARHVKVTHEDSPYFSVSCQKLAGGKVAPGMEITYQITFSPDEKKDYEHELVFVTEREKFIVPVQAIGARALLDFPDDISFSAAPVKYSSAKTVLVRNVGNKEARFSLDTDRPFSVSPTTAVLAVNACMQISVEFIPKKLGDHNKELTIHYDTGEEVYAQLYGSAVDVNVRLDRSSLLLEKTYLGLSSQRSVVIHNRSDVVVHYQWKAFASEIEEDMKRQDRAQQLTEEENLSKETFFERCMHDPSIRDRLPILTRSLDLNRKKYLDEERFLYSDEAITLDPIEGDIWPNSQAEVSVIFQPEEATSYSRVLYCDVTGRESRLPLKIRGDGIGPQCSFSFDKLDIQNVFVNSAHAYEIVLENKGDIEAVYSLVPSDSLFGPKFTFAPSNGVLHPGQLQAIQISFCSPELGDFDEEFQWSIEGSPQPLRLRVLGVVIGPTFQFDTTQIKFGTISYGFQSTKEVTLTNTSEIPMTFHLRVPGSNDDHSDNDRSSSKSKQFKILPQSGTLPPNFHQVIKLNFTPTSVKSYSTVLVVDINEAGKDVFSLPITARSVAPSVHLLTPLLDYGRCFLKHSYVREVELVNDSDLPVKYVMPPQVDKSAVCYTSPHSRGVIDPHTTLSIELMIEAQVQGDIMTLALIDVLGSTDPQLEVGICCIGEGPVINVSPTSLQWGVCPVLNPITKSVLLSNESLIPAEFECTLAREKTIFAVEPISAVIPPEESLELSVTALVDDCLKFSDKLTIVVSQGVSFTVSLSAEGRGTTIVSHPPLQPSVDLGPYFSNGPCQRQFTLTNRGRRLQALSWTTEGFSAAKLKKAEIERRGRDMKDMAVKRSSSKVLEVKKPLFEMIPNKFVLEPYQSIVVILRGFSNIPHVVNERLICHAIIGKNPHKERIMTVDVRASFVAPLLEFSTQELLFKLHQPPGSKLIQHSQELGVHNISPLPVTSVLLCEYPFSLIKAGVALSQMDLVLSPNEVSTVTVLYDSTYCVDKHSRLEDTYLAVAYKEHPQKDRISLKSEIYFPNLEFEAMELDFGCILNDTENIQYINMTNNSPLEVSYNWSFLKRPPVQRVDPCQLDEGVDMQSDCDTDSLESEEGSSSESGGEESAQEPSVAESMGTDSEAGSVLRMPSVRIDDNVQYVDEQSQQDSTQASTPQSMLQQQEEDIADVPLSSSDVSGSEDLEKAASSLAHSSKHSTPDINIDDTKSEASVAKSDKDESDQVSPRKTKRQPQPWELLADPFTPIGIEQIFDILPLHGVLQPGQSQQVQFSFYGHAGVATEVIAACRVEGGPTYQLRLSGEASDVQYKFSQKQIDLGKTMYDQTHTSQVVLHNRGKVGLDYCTLGVDDSSLQDLQPGCISMSPLMGHIPALEEQIITIHYLPGVPSTFKETLQVQVAHFEPDVITLHGEAVFPRISFDVPRDMCKVEGSILQQAMGNLGLGSKEVDSESDINDSGDTPPHEVEAEVERLLVSSFAQESYGQPNKTQKKASNQRPLPEFHLDFGYVVYGTVISRTLHLSNVGHCPVSFTTAHKQLLNSGFSVDLGDRIRSLPSGESLEFAVTFDPAAIKCSEGEKMIELPFNLIGGPSYSLKLSAQVTRPSMTFSDTHLHFGTVVCGQCRIITVRLANPLSVSCEWTAITDKPPKKIPRHIPLHVRKKMKEKPPPKFFEVNPTTGVLLPGRTIDIKVVFMPSEELHYTERIPFSIHQNPDSDLCLHVDGFGSEPQLIFSPSLAEFDPVLPFSPGSESEVTVSNPMPYPIEFYSLESDKQYLEEEETLRWVKGYDNQGRLLLPPPTPGESLPSEILTAFQKQKTPKADPQKTDTEPNLPSEANFVGESTVSIDPTQPLPSQTGLQLSELTQDIKTLHPSTCALASTQELSVIESLSGMTQGTFTSLPDIELEVSPVTLAIARYLGIDLSPAAAEAEKKKGVAIIIHGPPSSGRSTQCKSLGEKYDAAVLVMDEVVIAAISSASTPAGCKARECCIKATETVEIAEAPSNLSAVSKKQVNAKEKEKEKEAPITEVPTLPVPATPFSVQVLEDTPYAIPEGHLMPTVLPEDLVLEILADRLQHQDCHKGIIIDGIESYFTSSVLVSTALLLRSFSNRTHIYFVDLQMECNDIQKRLDDIEDARKIEDERIAEDLIRKQKEEEERIERLLALDEDEYEARSAEEQKEIDTIRLRVKNEKREKRRIEKKEQEQRERELQEEETRRLEEEKLKKKGRKDLSKQRPSNVVKPPAVSALLQQAATGVVPQSRPGSSVSGGVPGQLSLGGVPMTASGASVVSGTESPGGTPKRKVPKKVSARTSAILEDEQEGQGTTPLEKQYNYYTNMTDGIKSILDDWDRQKGVVRPKKPPEVEEHKSTPSRKGKGGKQKDDHSHEHRSETPIEESREGLGVPLITINAEQSIEVVTLNLFTGGLPSTESILEGLGLGRNGVPIPIPVDFQVYPFPVKRRGLEHIPHDRFCFIAASPEDPNAPKEEPPKSVPDPVEEPPQEQNERDHPSRMSKRTGSVRSMDSNESTSHRKSPQKATSRKKSSIKTTSPSPSQLATTQEEPPVVEAATKPTGPVKLVKFRWVIPAGGETKLKLLYNSEDHGQFDQTLNFEITGTRRRAQLFCRGHCVVPMICQEPRIVFPSRKKTKRKDEIVHKRFILSENAYFFGPLHCGKTRERYKEGRYPENVETLVISNTSLGVIEVEFCFQHDHNATAFLLDPPAMTLDSGESKTLTLWAYPKSPSTFKDAIVCCIKHNPNPVIFNIVCDGVEPDLKVDRKLLEFKKVLLHRKQTNVLYLHNHTMLPVAWRLSGLETLGEEFSFSQEHGIVQPLSDFPLSVHFRASKQVNYTKKAFKIEISDVEQIMGLMHVETVQVVAEAYDVALDISFPRGTDGGLDFQCIRVCDEQKLTIHLKNKGKYDIAYNFLFDVTNDGVDYTKMFQVSPTHSSLYPGEKAQPVNVVFRSDKEVTVTNVPILKCQVIDSHVGDQGEVIANIPIRISAKAVFSHCVISPINDINFGPLTVSARKNATFTLENKGEFEFKYAITKKMSPEQQKMRAISMAAVAAKNRTKSREGRESSARLSLAKPNATGGKNRTEGPLRTEVTGGSQRLVLGMFTVNSAMGSISAGQSQIVSVDCIAPDKPGKHEEILSIEISDRQKDSPPVTYRISGEVLAPEINTTDVASIFEEHRICRQLGVLGQHQFHGDGCVGVYGEEERRFVFKSVIVGQSSKARFKISNNNKIPCDVLITVKSATTKQKGANDAFDVEPASRIAIPSHSHIYATVTFKPMAMQCYNATLDVTPDGSKSKGLTFDLQGEGNLPQVSITRPTLHNAKGNPLLLYRKLLLNHSQALPIALKNTGTIPARVLLDSTNGSQTFTLMATEDELIDCVNSTDCSFEENRETKRNKSRPPVSILLAVNESKDCMVVFQPQSVKKYRGEVCVRIEDNQFEKMVVQLVGEGYEDEVYIENVRGEVWSRREEAEEVSEEVEATVENHLHFGSIAIGESRQVMFTLMNHSHTNTVKFQWPSLPCLTFTPSMGHIKPDTSKDIAVLFKSKSKPQSLLAQQLSGKLSKISFSKPLSEIPDWDDRMKSVRWVNVPPSQPLSLESSGTSSALRQSTVVIPTPAKKKVIETDPEPAHSVVDDSHRDLEVLISAVADFAKYECPVKEIKFKDTLMYQSKVYSFPLRNTGLIPLVYEWVVTDEQGLPLVRCGSQLGSESGVSIRDEIIPFSIEPSNGVIQPENEATITLKFSPLDVLNVQCMFKCNIPNLDASLDPLHLPVQGRSLMPYCHFDLDQTSDYLTHRTGDRRGGNFGSSGAIDPASTRVIEFNACGVGLKNVKRFEIINPTSSGYEFRWTMDGSLPNHTPFKCITPRGYIEGGKKYEIVFEYLPSSLDTVESLWCFSIPSISLSHSFLLVGHTDEPSVNLDRAYVSFKAMLIGTKVKETVYLVNNEPTAYKYLFEEKSCHCDGHAGQLVVEPMNGTIQPNARLPITISFTARHEQDFNFNLQCNIKHKPDPLVLNVKAKGYCINAALSYTSPNGTETSLPIAKAQKRVISFGSVPVNERALGQISLFNNGQYNMEYKWVLSDKCMVNVGGTDLVCVSPLEGTVVPQDRALCELSFAPPTKMVLKGCEILLQIANGPSLPITLRGIGVEPQVEFSFEEHNFGPCFLHRSDMPARRHTLTITNNDKKDVSVHCLFKNQPYLSVQFDSRILAPKEEAQAVFEFRPRETFSYSESVVFEINGLSRKAIAIKGDGAQMKIELANPAHKTVNFGALRIGEVVKKELKLANHSPIPLSFRLSLLPSSSTPALQEEGVLSVSPTEEITVDANGGLTTVSITFSPNTRVPQFSEEVTLECLGISQPLFVVSGSCHGLEISLDSEHVPFGPVVQQSQSSRRILMINSGDIGARFSWEHKFAPDFTLTPLDGYISPGMQITFDLTFHPNQLSHDIRYDKIPCNIEGRTKPLYLTLTGVCIEKVPVKEVLHFTTNVRSKETRHLTIHNKTNSQWLLRPLIEGEQWSGPETLSIGPNQPRHYELTYHPLTMTTDMQKHQGSIFFPQPDGTGLLYNLQGTAEAPKHSGAITQDIPCKTSHTELLPVANWLRRPQRFRVDVHMVRPEKLDRSVSLHGLDYIDVPALGKRDYKLHFYSFKECSILAKVTFRNELSGEYVYFHVNFKSTPPGIMGTIDLNTSVRKSASHLITVTNPLPTPVTLSTNCNVPDISLPSTFIVGAQTEGKCMFEYLPLKVGETTGKLSLQSTDLGVYQYELHLKSTSPPPERSVHFTTSLGTSQQQQVRFVSYARGRTEYICKVDSSDFHVERNITVASAGGGTEANVEVNFEPSHLGDTHATLTISSSSGGDYSFPLHGHCLAPKPQGPFTIKPGSSISIAFKNILTQSTQFSFSVDNPAFLVKAGDTLKARKTYNILVTYDAKQADPNVARTGKLTVTSQQSAKSAGTRGKSSGGITWVYYLKGLPPV